MTLSHFNSWETLWDESKRNNFIPDEFRIAMEQKLLRNKLEVRVNFSNHRVNKDDLQQRLAECYSTIALVAPLIKDASMRLGQDVKLIVTDTNGIIISCQSEDVIGYRCPAADLINNNDQLKKLVYMGNIVEVHYDNGLRSQLVPIFNEQGEIQFYWGVSDYHPISLEVSNILYLAAQLVQQRYKYVLMLDEYTSAFMNALPQCVLLLDENTRIINVNDQCLKLLKVNNKELLKGMQISNLISRQSSDAQGGDKDLYSIGFWGDAIPCHIVSRQPINTSSYGNQLELWSIEPFQHVLDNQPAGELMMGTGSAFDRIIGSTPEMVRVKSLAKRAARSSATVLIEGESGTGKELFAEALHRESRRQGMFVAINCGGIPSELIQSELFGYEEGAFTGARKRGCPGKFEIADGGTVFLDEIGEMPMDMQVSLLRFLQDKTVTRVGGHMPKKVDVRIIAATNRDLKAEVEAGNFREDLYYRLNVITLQIPPLRNRKEDIPLIASYLLDRFCHHQGVSPLEINEQAMTALMQYHWPGNARELENTIERAFILCQDRELCFDNLPQAPEILAKKRLQELTAGKEKLEKEAIEAQLTINRGNISQTARALGMTRQTLYRKIRALQIERQIELTKRDKVL